ncbi:hypothetical protein LEMLEM_LOCUS6221, partial [Lemmus lemmus]
MLLLSRKENSLLLSIRREASCGFLWINQGTPEGWSPCEEALEDQWMC